MTSDETDGIKRRIASGFSAAAPTYDTVLPYFETFAKHLVSVASPAESDRTLDVACGRGAVLRELLRGCDFRIRPAGVDLARGMVEQLRADGVGADLYVGDAEQLEFDDGAFDLVTCGFGVFFFPNPRAALAEVHRVTAPGGRFVASVFTAGSGTYPWLREVFEELGRPPGRPSPVSRSRGLIETLCDVGFDAVSVAAEVEERFVFRDVEEFIAWQASHGGRILLDALDGAAHERFRDSCAARLEAHRTDTGYELIVGVDVVSASRSQPDRADTSRSG